MPPVLGGTSMGIEKPALPVKRSVLKLSSPPAGAPFPVIGIPETRGLVVVSESTAARTRGGGSRMISDRARHRTLFHMAPSKRRGPRPVRDGSGGGPTRQIDALPPS